MMHVSGKSNQNLAEAALFHVAECGTCQARVVSAAPQEAMTLAPADTPPTLSLATTPPVYVAHFGRRADRMFGWLCERPRQFAQRHGLGDLAVLAVHRHDGVLADARHLIRVVTGRHETAPCSYCGQPILWADKTDTAEAMPLDTRAAVAFVRRIDGRAVYTWPAAVFQQRGWTNHAALVLHHSICGPFQQAKKEANHGKA